MALEGSTSTQKNELRAQMKSRMAAVWRDPASLQSRIAALIQNLDRVLSTNILMGGFRARPDEISLDAYFLARSGLVAYPRTIGHKTTAQRMDFYLPQTAADFEIGAFQIQEPSLARSRIVEAHEISALIIPGVAFDHLGYRMGRGQGFYDRYLEKYNGIKIGVALTEQISKTELPRESHDIAMDIVVTENYILRRFDS